MGLAKGEGRRALRILTPMALFLLAVAIRALPWRSVLGGGRVHLFGNDAFYHLRRIVFSIRHFPDVLVFDRYINFPDGARPIWTPIFDWAAALLLLPFARSGRTADLERAAIEQPACRPAAYKMMADIYQKMGRPDSAARCRAKARAIAQE